MPRLVRIAFALFAGWLAGSDRVRAQDRLFPPDAVVNVSLPPYRAIPDDGQDDTATLQRAINDNVGTGRVLYLPAGVYNVSDTLVAKTAAGLWRAHLTLQGQGRDRTTLRLADGAAGFDDPAHPRAVLMTGSTWEKGDSLDGGGNKAFRNNVWDLTIDTGKGNPGACGVEYAVSNFGALENVTIRSGDGAGVAGVSMRRHIPGPGLIRNVSVTGFDYGLDYGDGEYGMTVEGFTLREQRKAGIRVSDNVLSIRTLHDFNKPPAVIGTGRRGVLTMLDSEFSGFPFLDWQGTALVRGLFDPLTPGTIIAHWRAKPIPASIWNEYGEWCGPEHLARPPAYGPHARDPESDLLPHPETPDYWNTDLADWTPVGHRQPGESDDTAAIQRSIDSGHGTVYFPNNRAYFLSNTVVVRGKVRQVLGQGSEISLGAAEKPFSDRTHPRALFRIDPTDAETVFIENVFFNAQYPGEVLFEHNSPRTLVIKHCGGWVGKDGSKHSYRNTAAAKGARVFLEDVFLPGWEFTRQQVWARQLNPENWEGDGSSPQVLNDGGSLWILGFKTEGPAPFIATIHGGRTELLGAYNYVSATKADPLPATAIPYIAEDSRVSLSFATDNFRRNDDYPVYIREIVGGRVVHNWKNSDLPPRNGVPGDRSFAVSLYGNLPGSPPALPSPSP